MGLAGLLADKTQELAAESGISTVGLTGGVALNRLFSTQFTHLLHKEGFKVITHRTVPPNDGGLSLGQAWAAILGASEG